MNYPCGVSHDELENDRQTSPLEESQREAFFNKKRNDIYAKHQSDPIAFLHTLTNVERDMLLANLTNTVMFPDPKDDLMESYHKSVKCICDKMWRNAEYDAETEARGVWG